MGSFGFGLLTETDNYNGSASKNRTIITGPPPKTELLIKAVILIETINRGGLFSCLPRKCFGKVAVNYFL